MTHDLFLTSSRDFFPLFLPFPPLRVLDFIARGFLDVTRAGGDRGGGIGRDGAEGGVGGGVAADRQDPGNSPEQFLYWS